MSFELLLTLDLGYQSIRPTEMAT